MIVILLCFYDRDVVVVARRGWQLKQEKGKNLIEETSTSIHTSLKRTFLFLSDLTNLFLVSKLLLCTLHSNPLDSHLLLLRQFTIHCQRVVYSIPTFFFSLFFFPSPQLLSTSSCLYSSINAAVQVDSVYAIFPNLDQATETT